MSIKKNICVLLGTLLIGTSLGAATSLKVQATLMEQKMNVNGELKKEMILNYEGNTYVPLRRFGELTGIKVDYKNGTVIIGETGESKSPTPSTNEKTCSWYINSAIFKAYLGVEKAALDIYNGTVPVDDSFKVFENKMNVFLDELVNVEISETDECFVALQYTVEAAGSYLQAEKARIDALITGGSRSMYDFYISEANMLSTELNNELDKCGAWASYKNK